MIRRPPRSTLDRSSAASDVYKRQVRLDGGDVLDVRLTENVAAEAGRGSAVLKGLIPCDDSDPRHVGRHVRRPRVDGDPVAARWQTREGPSGRPGLEILHVIQQELVVAAGARVVGPEV